MDVVLQLGPRIYVSLRDTSAFALNRADLLTHAPRSEFEYIQLRVPSGMLTTN